ncbi:hypothetical protein I7I48_04579 [Histoplasma ohiense]|nr:hypothetical protein I7I48_04579 [Histoplasma ohiense (nom. inval.)]
MYEAPWRKSNVVEPEPNISPFLNTFTSLPHKLVICFFSRSTAQAKTCLKTPYTPLKLFLSFALINRKYCQLNQIKCSRGYLDDTLQLLRLEGSEVPTFHRLHIESAVELLSALLALPAVCSQHSTS